MSNQDPLNVTENNNLNEDELWYKAIQEDTIASYQNYVIIFPEGKKADKARSLIRHYEMIREMNIWEEAKSKNTVYNFQHYLKESRLKSYADEANRRLSESENRSEKQREDKFISTVKNATAKKSAKPAANHPGKIKFYPALFSILSVLVITAGLVLWNRPGSITNPDYSGVDSIIIPAMKSYNAVTEAATDSSQMHPSASDGNIGDQQSADNNSAALDNEGNNTGKEKEKVEENVVAAKSVEVQKRIENTPDSNITSKSAPTQVEPMIIKDSITQKEEFKGPLKILHGLQISVILDEPLSSEDVSKDGTQVKLHCSEDIEFDGKRVIAKGAPVIGKIVDVVPSTGRKKALIGFVIENITAANGTIINLYSQRYHKSASETGNPVFYSEGLVFYAKVKKQ
ncbi:MAG: hypothetical protein ABIN89_31235 [Chitinophagaceae bacterium]